MIQKAKVVELKGDKAIIDVYRSSACGESCGGSCAVCKTARAVRAEAKNPVGAKVGDWVEVSSASRHVLGLAFVLYIFPLVVAGVGYYAASLLMQNEDMGVLFACVGLILGFVPAIAQNRRAKKKEIAPLVVSRIIQ